MYNAQYEIRSFRNPRTAQEQRANAIETAMDHEYDSKLKIRRRELPCTYEDFLLSRNGQRSWKEAKRGALDGSVSGKRIKRRKSWVR